MAKVSLGSACVGLALLMFGVCAKAQSSGQNFFTDQSSSSLKQGAKNSINSLGRLTEVQNSCLERLMATGDQAGYATCLRSAMEIMAAAQKNGRPGVLDSCASAGYTTCYISRIAAVVVRIEAATSGSGVVIGDDGTSYLIATSKHVVDSVLPGESGEVIWGGKHIASFGKKDIWTSKKFDIALVVIRSNFVVPVAPIASPALGLLGKDIVVAGYPVDGDLPNKSGYLIRTSRGSVATQSTPDSAPDGYGIGYNSPTLGGMSGGGAFVSTSCMQTGPIVVVSPIPLLIGIHGRAETSEVKGATGFNFAVPVSALSAYPRIARYLDVKVQRASFGCPDGYSGKVESFLD